MEWFEPCVEPTDREELSKSVARTYRGEYDGWERVQEYNRYLEYQGEHPNKGSTAIASALELPRSRVRPWTNGSIPDPVRGIQTAADHGRLDLAWEGDTMRALTVAVAWVFSGGSINEGFVPGFAVEKRTRWLADELLEELGTGLAERHGDDGGRGTEVIPATDASVLDRTLVALGAPLGERARGDLHLPSWLAQAPEDIALSFARMYVTNRGVTRDEQPNYPVGFKEERDPPYRQEIRALMIPLVEGDTISGRGEMLYLTTAAASRLNQFPGLNT